MAINPVIDLQLGHHSSRSYTDTPVSDAQLDAIVRAAYQAPTSIHTQQVSLVVVRDAATRARLAELAGGQPWIAKAPVFIAVVIDLHKTAVGVEIGGATQSTQETLEGWTSATLDAGIALGNLIVAARSFGLGIVPIGGIRRDPQAVRDLLGLPPLAFAVNGLVIGHATDEAIVKPRLPIATFRHDERYDDHGLRVAITEFDATLLDYWRRIGRADGKAWSANTAGIYSKHYYPNVRPAALAAGFGFDA